MVEHSIGHYFLEYLVGGMAIKTAKVFVPLPGLYPGQVFKYVDWYMVFPGVKTGTVSLLPGIF